MSRYVVLEVKPHTVGIAIGSAMICLMLAAIAGFFALKSRYLEAQVGQNQILATQLSNRMVYLEKKAEILRDSYLNLVTVGCLHVGPNEMRSVLEQSQQLKTGPGGVGGGDETSPPP